MTDDTATSTGSADTRGFIGPLRSDLIIKGGDGRRLITFHADGSVTGNVDDASEAAVIFLRELRRIAHIPTPPGLDSIGVKLIAAERARQVTEEGYTAHHDRGHTFDLISAARLYTSVAEYSRTVKPPVFPPMGWPWSDHYWKPTGDTIRDLTKAGALIAAAIDALTEEG